MVSDGVDHSSEYGLDLFSVDFDGSFVPVHGEQFLWCGVLETVEAILVLSFVTYPVDAEFSVVTFCDVIGGEVVVFSHPLPADLKNGAVHNLKCLFVLFISLSSLLPYAAFASGRCYYAAIQR